MSGYRALIPRSYNGDLQRKPPNTTGGLLQMDVKTTHRFRREVVVESLKLIGRKPREEFVFEVFVASILPLLSSGNHRPSEHMKWTRR